MITNKHTREKDDFFCFTVMTRSLLLKPSPSLIPLPPSASVCITEMPLKPREKTIIAMLKSSRDLLCISVTVCSPQSIERSSISTRACPVTPQSFSQRLKSPELHFANSTLFSPSSHPTIGPVRQRGAVECSAALHNELGGGRKCKDADVKHDAPCKNVEWNKGHFLGFIWWGRGGLQR